MDRREAVKVAQALQSRETQRAALIKRLRDEDMMGLECAETVQLEKLDAEDVGVATTLAAYLLMEDAAIRAEPMEPALVWLRRRIKTLESLGAPPTHEQLAQAGVTYADRSKILANSEKAASDSKGELEALRRVLKFIEDRL